MRFEISFSGHQNIRSLHPKTIEITTDPHLTTDGDCIVGVGANAGCGGLPEKMKTLLKNPESKITCTISVKDFTFTVTGKGDERLTLANPHDIVIRKSSFVCPRTLATKCDAGSDAIPREMIRALQDPNTKGVFTIEVT